ncbi:MAG: TadE family protein [Anaerolineae bacterium]
MRTRFFRQHHGRSAGQEGQALTEFALSMTLLVALLVGIIALAWVGFCYVSIASAARMGTRHMLTYPTSPQDPHRFANVDAEITYVVTSSMPMLDWRQATVTILPQPPASRLSGTQVSVQIEYPMNTPTIRIPYVLNEGSFVLLPPITLNATSRMRLD